MKSEDNYFDSNSEIM